MVGSAKYAKIYHTRCAHLALDTIWLYIHIIAPGKMTHRSASWLAAVFLGACGHSPNGAVNAPADTDLRAPERFGSIVDRDERARALFVEASRVLVHPRCVNCHPSGDSPAQGDDGRVHDPPVSRGDDDRGVWAMRCTSCHQDTNLVLARVPGAPSWHLAPRPMAWVGHTPGAICEQMKDPARNGGKTLAAIVEHATHDPLVGWAWTPGSGRAAPPGSQERFGALIAAWANDGAACPQKETQP